MMPERSSDPGPPDAVRDRTQVHQASLGPPVRFDGQSFTLSVSIDETPLGLPLVGQLKSGRLACAADGRVQPHRCEDVFLAIQPEHPHLARFIDVDGEVAVIGLALLSQLAADPGQAGPQVRFTGHEPVSPQAGRSWKATYAFVRDSVLASGTDGIQPLLAFSAARLLAAVTLATFPNTTITDS